MSTPKKKKKKFYKKRTPEDPFYDNMTDPCPRCGVSQYIKQGQAKEEAERDFKKRHTKKACDRSLETNKWVEDMEKQSCPICGIKPRAFACLCEWKNTSKKRIKKKNKKRNEK